MPAILIVLLVLALRSPAAPFPRQQGGEASPELAELRASFDRGCDALDQRRPDEAIAAFKRALELEPFNHRYAYFLAKAYVQKRELDAAIGWLDLAAEWGCFWVDEARSDVDIAPLRDHPKFPAILAGMQINLAAEAGDVRGMSAEGMFAARAEIEQVRERARATPIAWLDGHAAVVTQVRFSPDGERVASVGADGAIWLWNAFTGEPMAPLGPVSSRKATVSFDRRGERLLVFDPAAGTAELRDGRSGDLLVAHHGEGEFIRIAHLSADGGRVLVVDLAGSATLRDATSGERLLGLGEGVESEDAVFSPDGDFVLTRVVGDRATVWDTVTGAAVLQIGSESLPVVRPAFTSDGRRIIAADKDCRVLSWRIGGGSTPTIYSATGDSWNDLHLAPDGRSFVAETERGALVLWSSASGTDSVLEERGMLEEASASRTAVYHDPLGERVLTMADGKAKLWSAQSGDQLAVFDCDVDPHMAVVRFSPDGRRLAVSPYQPWPDIRVWNARTGELQGSLRFPAIEVADLDFSADGERLALGIARRLVAVWDGRGDHSLEVSSLPPAEVVLTLMAPHFRSNGGSLAPDGVHGVAHSLVAPLIDLPGVTCCLWDLRTGQVTRSIGSLDLFVNHVAFDRRGGALLAGCNATQADPIRGQLVDLERGSVTRAFRTGSIWSCASADGKRCITVGTGGEVDLADLESGILVAHLRSRFVGPAMPDVLSGGLNESSAQLIAGFSADGKWVATGELDGSIRVFDARDGTLARRMTGHTNVILSLAFAPRGTLMASTTAGLNGEIRVWDLERGTTVRVFRGHKGYVYSAAFDPEVNRLVSTSEDHTARIWSLRSEIEPLVLRGHAQMVTWAVFSPDGKRVLTGSADATARLWDATTGDALHVLEGHLSRIFGGEFSEDGAFVLTRGRDATLRLWDGRNGKLLLTRVAYANDAWLAFDPRGYYIDGGDAADWARVNIQDKSLPLSSYAKVLRSPERIAASLAGEVHKAPILPSAPSIQVVTPRSGPVAERAFRLEVLLEDRFAIESVAVTQDGVPIAKELVERGLALEPGNRTGRLACSLEIPESRSDTTIRVRATNVRGILSDIETVQLRYERPDRRLFVLALGVGDYQDDSLDLKYPVKDADDLIGRLRSQAGSFYTSVEVLRLADREVDAAALQRAQRTFLLEARPTDTILVFVAGHGMRNDLNEYWFLTSTATVEDPYSGIDREDLERLVTWDKLHARKRILLIDTCHSGTELGARGVGTPLFEPARVDALVEESKSGLYVLAASSDDQFAREQEGNGIFTAALLEALDGAADQAPFGNGDGYVQVEELKALAAARVLERSHGKQTPTFPRVLGGENFRLAKVARTK